MILQKIKMNLPKIKMNLPINIINYICKFNSNISVENINISGEILIRRLLCKKLKELTNIRVNQMYPIIKAKYALMDSCLFKINLNNMKYFNTKNFSHSSWLCQTELSTQCNSLTKKNKRCKNKTKGYICSSHKRCKDKTYYNGNKFICPPIFII